MAAMFFFHLSCVCLRRPQADALTLWSCFQGLRTPTPVSPNDNDSLETLCNYFCDLIGKIQKAALNSKAGGFDTLLRNALEHGESLYVFLFKACVDHTRPREKDLD